MSDVPVEVVVAAFQDEKSADAALKELKDLKKQNYYIVLTGFATVAGQLLSFYVLPRRNCCLATATFASLAFVFFFLS